MYFLIVIRFDRFAMWSLFVLFIFAHHGWGAQCDRTLTEIPVRQELLAAFKFQDTVTNTNGQPVSLIPTSNKKVVINTNVMTRSRIFCWYQRMLEVHNKDNGPVIKDCSCNPSLFTASPTTSLPADCYSPSGDSCDWYRNCLEKKYACEATSNLRK